MGNWHISIEGIGCHHNNDEEADADRIARETVAKLKEKGHTVTKASFTSGGADDLNPPDPE